VVIFIEGGQKMFLEAVKIMKRASITKLPIKVRRVNLNGFDGLCEKKKTYFLIKINKNLTENHSIDVLIHEIAHVDAWGKGDIHGKEWGVSYSRLYQIWETHIDGLFRKC